MIAFVYFLRPIGMPGPIKIGHSYDPDARLGQIQYQSPYPLEIVARLEGDQYLERKIQNSFADYHSHGEWFHPGERLLRSVAALQRGVTLAEAVDLEPRGNVLGATQKASAIRNGTDKRRRGPARKPTPLGGK